MEVKVDLEKKVPVLDISGEIDHFVAPELQKHIDSLVKAGHERLVLDLLKVNYLDSGGIGILFSAMHKLAAKNGNMAVVLKDKNVIRILELVGLFDPRTNVELYEDKDTALSELERKQKVGQPDYKN